MGESIYDELTCEMDAALDGVSAKRSVRLPKGAAKALAVAAAAAALAAGAYALSRDEAPAGPDHIPGELLVKFERELTLARDADGDVLTGISSVDTLNERITGETYEQLVQHSDEHDLDTVYVVTLPESTDLEAVMEQFSVLDEVDYVERNAWMYPDYEVPDISPEQLQSLEDAFNSESGRVPNDTYYGTRGAWGQDFLDMWGLHNTQAAEAWELTTGSPRIIVAITDTGVDYNHPDIAGRVLRNPDGSVAGYDFANGDSDPMDDQGHGTHVAGTIAARTDNSLGIAGVTWEAMVLPIKVCNAAGGCSWDDVARGFIYAADHGAQVVNVSLGSRGRIPQTLSLAINYADAKGTFIVTSAGNANEDASNWTPKSHPYVFVIAATTHEDERASFSNWGPKVDVGAPGEYILSLLASDHKFGNRAPIVGGRYVVLRGTSMAAPHVVGDIALILAANPELIGQREAVREVLRAGVDEYPEQPDRLIGTGRINYLLAVREAQEARGR